jgi:hypothetical protein
MLPGPDMTPLRVTVRKPLEICVIQFAPPLERAHRDQKKAIGKKRAIPQRGTTRRWNTAPSAG